MSYAGYMPPAQKRPWGNLKLEHRPRCKVALSFPQFATDSELVTYNGVRKAFAGNSDYNRTAVSTGSQFNIPQQIQPFNTFMSEEFLSGLSNNPKPGN